MADRTVPAEGVGHTGLVELRTARRRVAVVGVGRIGLAGEARIPSHTGSAAEEDIGPAAGNIAPGEGGIVLVGEGNDPVVVAVVGSSRLAVEGVLLGGQQSFSIAGLAGRYLRPYGG